MKSEMKMGAASVAAVKRIACLTTLVFTLRTPAQADDVYWDGSFGSWHAPTGWSTSPTTTTPDPGSAPGSSDVAIFNIDGVPTAQTITLDADQAASKLKVLGSATDGVTLLGGGTDATLSLGTGGIEVLDGAGSLVIGSDVPGQGVALSMTGNQIWTNGSANAVIVQNGIGALGAQTLTLTGAGGFQLNGPSSFTGGTTLSASTVGLGDDATLGDGTVIVNSGTILVEDFPRTVSNRMKMDTGLTKTWAGDGALTLEGSETAPAFAISVFTSPTINLINTAPLTISGMFSLSDHTSPNNGKQGFSLGSGANLIVSGDIWECNTAPSASTGNMGAKFVFKGSGANLTLSGDNKFGEAADKGTSVQINFPADAHPASYNTITVGGPGGAGATITPFGLAALETNYGQGFYLKALENGQIVLNSIKFASSTSNQGATPLGFDGENDMTLAGKISLGGGNVSFVNMASGTLTLAGEVSVGSRVLTILGAGDTVLSLGSSITGTTGGFGKNGPGSLTLAATNSLTGSMALNGGSVVLDYSSLNENLLAQGTTAAALTLGGVELQLKGGSYAQSLGTGGGTTMAPGQSRVSRTNASTATLALGGITRATGSESAINFKSGVASTTSENTDGTLGSGGFATVNASDWAVGDGTIIALAMYDSFAEIGTDKNVLVTGDESVAGKTINTLKIAPTAAGQALTLSGTVSLERRGLLFVGDHDYTISGSTFRGKNAYKDELIVQQYGGGILTINSVVAERNNTVLIKAGPGTLVLSNSGNTYKGPTVIVDGVLSVPGSGSLGNGASGNIVSFNGGTLETTVGFAMSRKTSFGPNGGTLKVDNGTLELSGEISGYGEMNKTGAGTLLLSGVNTFKGPKTILEGTLKLGNERGLGLSSTNGNCSLSPVAVKSGSVLDIAGFNAAIGNFTLVDGTVEDSVGGGSLAAYSFNLNKGTVNAALVDLTPTGNPMNLFKRTVGTVTLTAENTYSGTTFVDGGTLCVNGSLEASAVIVGANGTLGGTGMLKRTVNIEGGVLAPGDDGTGMGTITLDRFLRIANSGSLKAGFGTVGSGRVIMTHPQARIILENAALDASVFSGGGAILAAGVILIDNQGSLPVEGTFVGLAEGATVTLGSGREALISYRGGDGNDVALVLKNPGTTLIIR